MRRTEPYSAASTTAPAPVAAVPCVAAVEGSQRGLRREHAGEVVARRHAGAHGRTVRVAGEVEQPAVADAQTVEAGPGGVRPVLAEGGDAHHHEARVEIRRARVPQRSSVPGRKFSHDDVGRRGQPPEQLAGRRSCRRSIVTLLRPRPSTAQNSEYPSVDERTDLAHEVARARLLDLDHLGALLAEQTRRRTAPRCACRGRAPASPRAARSWSR